MRWIGHSIHAMRAKFEEGVHLDCSDDYGRNIHQGS